MDRPAHSNMHRETTDLAGRSRSDAILNTLDKLVRMRDHLERVGSGAPSGQALWRLRMWLGTHPYVGSGGMAELRTGMWPVVQAVAPGNAAGASLLQQLNDLLKPGGTAPTGQPGTQRIPGTSGGGCY